MRAAIDLRRAALILLVLAGACYPGWLVVGSFAEPPAAKGKDDKPITKTPLHLGASSCSNAGCHGGTPPAKWPLPLLCKCDEYNIWEKEDKHADAYNVLLGARGKRMGELLRYDVTKDAKPSWVPQGTELFSVVFELERHIYVSSYVDERRQQRPSARPACAIRTLTRPREGDPPHPAEEKTTTTSRRLWPYCAPRT